MHGNEGRSVSVEFSIKQRRRDNMMCCKIGLPVLILPTNGRELQEGHFEYSTLYSFQRIEY